jgi:probable phosphoglycerate mutase
MASLYLVRHGLAEAGVEALDPGLAPLGHEQAQAAARALVGLDANRLLVSPTRRTQETALHIARELGLEPEITASVGEVYDPAWTLEQRRDMLGPFLESRWPEQPPALQAWRQRVLDTLLACPEEDTWVVVSHYIAIGVAIGVALEDDRVVPMPMANAAISMFVIENGELVLIDPVSTTHLALNQVTGMATARAG